MRPTSGEAWVAGHSILHEGEQIKEKIGYMSQRFGLYEDLTVMENINFYADLYVVPHKERPQRNERLLGFRNLTPFKNRLAGKLSGGMKQRVGIARALALQPEVLLMDEPFSSLDELTAKNLRSLVMDLRRRSELSTNTFIMVSHNVEEAVFMADRVVVMSSRPGKIIGDIKVDIPRPRMSYLRDQIYFKYVDEVVSVLERGK
jgi:ABC-type nitrate/sulfonate/bicarbonate transport system ATPase subunit